MYSCTVQALLFAVHLHHQLPSSTPMTQMNFDSEGDNSFVMFLIYGHQYV